MGSARVVDASSLAAAISSLREQFGEPEAAHAELALAGAIINRALTIDETDHLSAREILLELAGVLEQAETATGEETAEAIIAIGDALEEDS